MVRNTSYKVQVDVDTDVIRNQYNIEEGAFVTTESRSECRCSKNASN